MMHLYIFLWSHFRSTRARSSPSFVPLADFKLSLRPRDTIGELSREVRGVVFVFDLLLNFKFVFSYLDTFGHHPLGQRPSLELRLGSLWTPSRVSLSDPPQTPPGPPFKSDPFLVDSLTQDGHFWVRSCPGPFLGLRRPSTGLIMLLWLRSRSNLSRNSSVDAAPLRFSFSHFLNFFETCLWPHCR